MLYEYTNMEYIMRWYKATAPDDGAQALILLDNSLTARGLKMKDIFDY